MADEDIQIDTAGAVDAYLKSREEPEAARSSVGMSLWANPDKEAEYTRLAKQAGIPLDSVRAFPEDVKRQQFLQNTDWGALSKSFPNTSRFLSNPSNAQQAHDDIEPLKVFEGAFKDYLLPTAEYLTSAPGTKRGFVSDVGAGLYGFNRGASGVLQAGAEAFAPLLDPLAGTVLPENPLRRAAAGFAGIGERAGAAAKALSPPTDSIFEGGVSSGVQSLTQNLLMLPLALLPGGAPVALSGMAGSVSGQAYQDARENGLQPLQALPFAVAQGVVEYATEKLPLGVLLGDVAKNAGFAKMLGRQLATEIPTEQLATVLQDLNEWAVLNPGKPFAKYLEERPSAAAQTLIATVIGAAGSSVAVRALDGMVTTEAERRQRVQNAADAGGKLQAALQAAGQSKLRERNPESFSQLVEQMAIDNGGAPKSIFMDTEAFLQAVENLPIQELERMLPTAVRQMLEENTPGGLIEVPLSEVLAGVPGTELEPAFIKYSRADENALTQAEAEEQGQQADQFLQQEAERVLQSASDAEASRASSEAVKTIVLDQLNTANRFKPDVNNAYATLVRDFYTVMSSRVGMTPEQMYQQYPLRVVNAPTAGESLEQPAFHGTPHRGIDKFSTDKIGTGEGAQAYGWGLYFAGKREIAEFYKNKLTEGQFHRPDGAVFDARATLKNPNVRAVLDRTNGDIDAAIARAKSAIEVAPGTQGAEYAAEDIAALQKLKAEGGIVRPAGQLYEVEVPEDESMLLWDKPLSDQPAMVRAVLESDSMAELVEGLKRDGILGDYSAAEIQRLTGEDFYDMLRQANGDDQKAASDALAAAGIKGIKYLDGDSRNSGEGSYNYVVFSGDDVSITGQFYQGPRGTFSPSQLLISLSESANYSTFLHESGHFFLEVLSDIATQPNAPAQIVDDMGALMKWFGVEDAAAWRGMTLDQQRPYHERFAESFEQYLFEGKAPNTELRGVFQRFRAWLTKVYKSLPSFIQARTASAGGANAAGPSDNPLGLSDEIRQVMDRLLATDEQIAEAERVNQYGMLFKSAEEAGMTPEEWASYTSEDEKAHADALSAMDKKSLKDMSLTMRQRMRALKDVQKDVKAKRKEVEVEARAMIAEDPTEKARQALKAKGLTDVETAAVADANGFESVEAMRAQIEAVDPKMQFQNLVDLLMLEKYGELTTPRGQERAADEAVHNENRARVLATEMRAIQRANGATRQTDAGGSINALTAAARQFAAALVGRKLVGKLNPNLHAAAAQRAARKADQAIAKGDTQAAIVAKRDQLLNHQATRATMDAQTEAQKIKAFFARVVTGKDTAVSKSRDMDIVQAARAVLGAYGVGRRSANSAKYLETLANNDPQMYGVLKPSIDAALVNAKPLDELTMTELRELKDDIDAMWFLAKRTQQMEVDGNLMDIRDAADGLQARMQDIGVPDTVPGELQAITTAERAGRTLQFAGSILRRVEQWTERMDGRFGGPFLKTVFQPIKQAADRYRTARAETRGALTKLVQDVAPSIKPGLIAAPELNYTFGAGKGGVGMAELLHAILHTGNASNKRKLLLGRKWGAENSDGTVDTRNWDAFLQRMIDTGVLTKAHYDFAQGVWDLLDGMKPLAQKTHREVFGRYFEEVTADPFETPFGKYRGGYVPAQADPDLVQDQALRNLANQENENMAFAFPAPGKGFTKSRVEYNRPLVLDIRSLSQHIDKVLLFSHMTAPARDVQKLLATKDVSQSLSRLDPSIYEGMLIPWLNRSARQQVETPIVGDGKVSRVLSTVRARAGMSLMFANISNTIQQVSGLSSALVKVDIRNLMGATAQYIASPRKTANAVAEASPFMRNRMENEVQALTDTMNEILLDPSLYERAQAWTNKHTYFLQSALDNVLSPIVWTGAYNQGLKQGMSEADAMKFADGTVRQTQGSTLPEDVSRIETGPAYARVFTQFIGYFNMVANTNATALQQITREAGLRKGAGRAVGVLFFGLLAPAWIAEAIAIALRGGPEDKEGDGYLDDWIMQVVGMGTLKMSLAGVPFVGQLINAGINRFNDKPYDDRVSLSPAVSLLESTVGAPQSVYKAIAEDGNKAKAVRDVATALSVVTGLPFYAVARPLSYAAGLADGAIQPTNEIDAARGLVTGTASPDSKR